MKLNTFDRLMVLNNLPAEGNLLTIKIVRQLREALSFSEAEHKALGFVEGNGRVTWNEAGDKEKEVAIGETAHKIIKGQLEKLSKDEKLTEAHLSVCEKFGVVE